MSPNIPPIIWSIALVRFLVYVCQLRCDAWAGMSIAAKATSVSAFVQPLIRLWPDAYNVAKVQKYLLSFVRYGRKNRTDNSC